MVRRNKVNTTQMPLAGFTAPPTPTPEAAPKPAEEAEASVPPPPEPKPQNTAANAQQQTPPSKPKEKAAHENIHHHVLENDQIVECFGTLSEALFKQQESKQLGADSTTIESYAGKGPCRRKITSHIGNSTVTKSNLVAENHDAEENTSPASDTSENADT